MEPPELSEIEMNRVKEFIPKALTALEIENGASHSEFKLDADGNVRIIETVPVWVATVLAPIWYIYLPDMTLSAW